MKANTAFVPNKKLILHFDVHQVLCLPSDVDKDLYVIQARCRSMNFVPIGSGDAYREPIKIILIS
jgi:hypothetical protein